MEILIAVVVLAIGGFYIGVLLVFLPMVLVSLGLVLMGVDVLSAVLIGFAVNMGFYAWLKARRDRLAAGPKQDNSRPTAPSPPGRAFWPTGTPRKPRARKWPRWSRLW